MGLALFTERKEYCHVLFHVNTYLQIILEALLFMPNFIQLPLRGIKTEKHMLLSPFASIYGQNINLKVYSCYVAGEKSDLPQLPSFTSSSSETHTAFKPVAKRQALHRQCSLILLCSQAINFDVISHNHSEKNNIFSSIIPYSVCGFMPANSSSL